MVIAVCWPIKWNGFCLRISLFYKEDVHILCTPVDIKFSMAFSSLMVADIHDNAQRKLIIEYHNLRCRKPFWKLHQNWVTRKCDAVFVFLVSNSMKKKTLAISHLQAVLLSIFCSVCICDYETRTLFPGLEFDTVCFGRSTKKRKRKKKPLLIYQDGICWVIWDDLSTKWTCWSVLIVYWKQLGH